MPNTIPVGKIVEPRKKGEITIPIEYRRMFGITPNTPLNIMPFNGGLLLVPVDIIPRKMKKSEKMKRKKDFDVFLKETYGAWGKSNESGEEYVEKVRRNLREREYVRKLRAGYK